MHSIRVAAPVRMHNVHCTQQESTPLSPLSCSFAAILPLSFARLCDALCSTVLAWHWFLPACWFVQCRCRKGNRYSDICAPNTCTHTKSNNTKKSENNPRFRNSYIITYLFFGIYQITFCTVLADQVYPCVKLLKPFSIRTLIIISPFLERPGMLHLSFSLLCNA